MHAIVRHREWVCTNGGQMWTPGANFCCCRAKACFLFTPFACAALHVCVWNQRVAHGRHAPCWVVCIMATPCVWQQHIIISLEVKTEWSLQPTPLPAAVCSALIYRLKASVEWSVQTGVRWKPEHIGSWDLPLCSEERSFTCRSFPWMNMMWWTWSMRRWF